MLETAAETTNFPSEPPFIDWLLEESCITADGKEVDCYMLDWIIDEEALEQWALHIRRHYIRDDELKRASLLRGTDPASYLICNRIPGTEGMEAQLRSGDFAEIVISDILQFIDGYTVPRYKQHGRDDKRFSRTGVDVVAYMINDAEAPSEDDELVAIEVKSSVSKERGADLISRINDAASDSKKDPNRLPMTLEWMIDKCDNVNDEATLKALLRFTKKGDYEFKEGYGSGVVASTLAAAEAISGVSSSQLGLSSDERLIVVHGSKLMGLVHELYSRCTR